MLNFRRKFYILTAICILLQILHSCNGHKSHHRNQNYYQQDMNTNVKIPEPTDPLEDQSMGGCYMESVPKAERISPPICTALNELQTSACPFNMTAKWIPGHGTNGNFEVCIISNNDTDIRLYTLTVKEVNDGKELNPRHGKWKHMGNQLCCFANGRSVEEMKAELHNSTIDNYFEKAVVFESSDLEHCGKWHSSVDKTEIGTVEFKGTHKFIGVVCDKEKRCWKNQVESWNGY